MAKLRSSGCVKDRFRFDVIFGLNGAIGLLLVVRPPSKDAWYRPPPQRRFCWTPASVRKPSLVLTPVAPALKKSLGAEVELLFRAVLNSVGA
jgi:hypothetical protein